jgi:hypothetical protein
MKLFDTMAERYRRHRAIHKYDRWLRFWLLDTAIFLVKLALIAGVVISVIHYTPLIPDSVRQYAMDWRANPTQSAVATSSQTLTTDTTNVDEDSPQNSGLAERTVIPASLAPQIASQGPTTLKVVTIEVALANLRERPTTDSAILGQLRNGSKISLFGMSGRWAQVATNDESGITGYVHVSLLEEDEGQLRQQFASP